MTRRGWTGSLTAAAVILLAGLAVASPRSEEKGTEPDIAKSVRKELSGLPYYGVFDLLTYQVSDKGVVTLGGYVYRTTLKDDAERAVKTVKGVTSVDNKIENLPVSGMDDDIRGAVYRAIYRDPGLSRYGTPEDTLLASRPRFRAWGRGFRRWAVFGEPRWTGRPFLGMEPVGNYAIHILVANGNVTLVGVVDRQADRDLAGIKASGVAGVFKVTNDLQVESEPEAKPKAK
jgi:hyperosmotically inducible protein